MIPLLTPAEVAQLPGIHVWSDDDPDEETICCLCKLPRHLAEGSACSGYCDKGTIDMAEL